jgi:uncharacterized protein (DUF2252 family)
MAAVTSSGTWLSVAERAARGKAARQVTPRSAQGEWMAAAGREDPIAILERQAATRIAELVPIRHGRMLASPFAFFRGAAAIMAADLAGTRKAGLEAQLCGDAHVSNFGIYAAPDRRLVFDLDDFDETHRGPWEWDVKRLAASLEIAGRHGGIRPRSRRTIVRAAAREYRKAMRAFATEGNLAVWYARVDVEQFLDELAARRRRSDLADARRVTAKARRRDSERALAKLTERAGGEPRFRDDPPLLVRAVTLADVDEGRLLEQLGDLLGRYRSTLARHTAALMSGYRIVDIARKVVGVGSVGIPAWVVLLVGRDDADPLVLQAKQAQASVLEAHLAPADYANHGERVVEGQRVMQAASDILLGWDRAPDLDGVHRDLYVRQLWDGKGSIEVEELNTEQLRIYARVCAWTLARAHARSGDRIAIASYLGSGDRFDQAVAAFAAAYADQNELDFHALERAVDDGRVEARMDV